MRPWSALLAFAPWVWSVACSAPSATNLFDSPTSNAIDAGGANASAGSPNSGPALSGGVGSGGSAAVDADAGDGGEAGRDELARGGASDGDAGADTAGGANGTSGAAGRLGNAGGGGNAGAGGTAGAAGNAGGAGGGRPIMQLRGTATASSSENDPSPGGGIHPARAANDGDETSTRWCAATKDVPAWWQVDLGASRPLSRVELVWEYPAQALGQVYGYTVSVSDDAARFAAPAIDRRANTSTDKTQSQPFPAATTGRYVRITVTSLPADSNDMPPFETWASLYEVRVFGQ